MDRALVRDGAASVRRTAGVPQAPASSQPRQRLRRLPRARLRTVRAPRRSRGGAARRRPLARVAVSCPRATGPPGNAAASARTVAAGTRPRSSRDPAVLRGLLSVRRACPHPFGPLVAGGWGDRARRWSARLPRGPDDSAGVVHRRPRYAQRSDLQDGRRPAAHGDVPTGYLGGPATLRAVAGATGPGGAGGALGTTLPRVGSCRGCSERRRLAHRSLQRGIRATGRPWVRILPPYGHASRSDAAVDAGGYRLRPPGALRNAAASRLAAAGDVAVGRHRPAGINRLCGPPAAARRPLKAAEARDGAGGVPQRRSVHAARRGRLHALAGDAPTWAARGRPRHAVVDDRASPPTYHWAA